MLGVRRTPSIRRISILADWWTDVVGGRGAVGRSHVAHPPLVLLYGPTGCTGWRFLIGQAALYGRCRGGAWGSGSLSRRSSVGRSPLIHRTVASARSRAHGRDRTQQPRWAAAGGPWPWGLCSEAVKAAGALLLSLLHGPKRGAILELPTMPVTWPCLNCASFSVRSGRCRGGGWGSGSQSRPSSATLVTLNPKPKTLDPKP